jgi:hypothetical protein
MSLVVVQAVVLLGLAVMETASVSSQRQGLGVSTAVFFAVYGVVLAASAWGLWRRAGWARGPVLITQLIVLGLAWNLRDDVLVALGLAACAGVVLAGMLHPATIAALDRDPTEDADPDA